MKSYPKYTLLTIQPSGWRPTDTAICFAKQGAYGIIKNNSYLRILPMSTVRLSTLKPGESATIAALHTDEALYHRLAAMGFRIGKRIDLVRRAKFAGPLHVRIGTTDIMLRRSDAQNIDVTPADAPQ